MVWELCITGFPTLSPAPARYGIRMSRNTWIDKVSRMITGHTGQTNDRGWSPPYSWRLFNGDDSLLRVNLLAWLRYGDVRDTLKIPGNRPLLDHIW